MYKRILIPLDDSALASASRFSAYGEEGKALGALIINVITATTFVVQIIGPICVKLAISRAGEIGRATLERDAWASEGTPEGLNLPPPVTRSPRQRVVEQLGNPDK